MFSKFALAGALALTAAAPAASFAQSANVDAFISGGNVGFSCSIDAASAQRALTQTNATTADLPPNNAGGNLFQISQNTDATWTFSGLSNVGDNDATSGYISLNVQGGVNSVLQSTLGGSGDTINVDGRVNNAPVFMDAAQIVDDGGLSAEGQYRIRGVLECVAR